MPADPAARPLVALTGASGFLGGYLVPALHARGFRVRILTRRDPTHSLWRGLEIEVVPGTLEDEAALARLVAGADAVVHAAGLIKARDRQGFLAVNRDGTARLAQAVRRLAPAAAFLLISSLAARCPELSAYAESKSAAESAAAAALPAERLTILRPPAIYGPGDRETLVLFQLAKGAVAPLSTPSDGRTALVHAQDAARAVAALAWAGRQGIHGRWYLADTRPEGYRLREILAVAAHALGASPRFVQLPGAIMHVLGATSEAWGALSGRTVMLTRGKAREIRHSDWGVRPAEMPPPTLWQPAIAMPEGIAATALWYRDAGLL